MTEIDLTPITRLEYDIDAILNDHAVAEPITRIELILADIVAGNTTTVEPVTRIETYLAIISGADYPVPEPVTRIETFLAIIAGEDYEEPEAVTRLEGLLAEWVEKGSGIWKTVSGTLIHITDALASPMQKCEITLESIQDLHGQDAPYPAGGGVNKANLVGATAYNDGTYGMYVTVDEQNETITLSGIWSKEDQGSGGTWRFLNVPNIQNWLGLKAFEVTSGNHVYQLYWDGANNRLIIRIGGMTYGSAYTITFKIVAYEGSTEPTSWSPFANICPITGWTGCEVNRTGVNLFDKSYYSDYSNYTKPFSNYYFAKLQLKPNTAYVFNPSSTARLDTNRYYVIRIITGSDPDDLSNSSFVYPISSGTPSKTQFTTGKTGAIWFGVYYQDGADTLAEFMSIDWQLELGSTATEYEPYSGTTLSVTFPDGQTVYGGTVDLVSGVLVADKVVITDFANLYIAYNTEIGIIRSFYVRIPNNITRKADTFVQSSLFKSQPLAGTHAYDCEVTTLSGLGDRIYFSISNIDYPGMTAVQAQQFLIDNSVQFLINLATPITYQLTPRQISTLKGVNNVWSNSNGDTTIIYKAQA